MSLVAVIACAAAILLRAVPIPIGLMLERFSGSLWNATLSLALTYCRTSLGRVPLNIKLSRVVSTLILGNLSSFWFKCFDLTRKISFNRSVESAKGPEDLSFFSLLKVEMVRDASQSLDRSISSAVEYMLWWRDCDGRGRGCGDK